VINSRSSRSQPAVNLRGVEMRFGAVRALSDISFSVPEGSLCGLVGPNGAGKTTTLRIIATDLEPMFGEVEVLGCSLPGDHQKLRPVIGYMPETAAVYDELSLAEYLGFFAAFHGLGRGPRQRAVETVMALVRIDHMANRRLEGLSRGEKQRVLLARSLIHDPKLLILDEPASGLDPQGRVELRELLRLLNERGKTVLISSHILSDLEDLCTHLVLIDQGRVLFQGEQREIMERNLNRYQIRIEAINDLSVARQIIQAHRQVRLLEDEGQFLIVNSPADPKIACELLRALVDEGVTVTNFARRPTAPFGGRVIAYVRMLALRWRRRAWGVGSMCSMLIIPGIVTATIELRRLAFSDRSGFELEAVLYSTTALAVGLVAFALFVLIQEERVEGRGRALQVAGVEGARLATAQLIFGCLISTVFVVLGTASMMLVSAVVGSLGVSWGAAGSAIVAGICAMVPILLLMSLLLPAVLSRPMVVVLAITVAWVTTSVAVDAGKSGISAAIPLGVAAAIGIVSFTGLSIVWKRLPAGYWQ